MTEAISTGGVASVDRTWMRWGAIAIVAALVADVLYNINVKAGDNGGTGPMLGVGGILIVVGAVLYLTVFPRITNAERWSLVLGILTVLSLGAFWSAAPLLLAPAVYALWTGVRTSTPARIGLGLAAIAAVVDLVGAVTSAF